MLQSWKRSEGEGRLSRNAEGNFLIEQPGYRVRRNMQDAYQDQLETALEIYKNDLSNLNLK